MDKPACPHFVILPNTLSKEHQQTGGKAFSLPFFDDCLQRQVCFIKFYSSGLSERGAVRPPSFPLCKPSISAPTLLTFPFLSISLSLSLCLLPPSRLCFSSRSCISLQSYSSLLSLCGPPFPSRAGVTPPQPSSLAAHSSQKRACGIVPGRRLLLAMGTEKEREMKGLCNHSATQLTGSLTRVLLR